VVAHQRAASTRTVGEERLGGDGGCQRAGVVLLTALAVIVAGAGLCLLPTVLVVHGPSGMVRAHPSLAA
jgi:hypothetical protein